jgi:hypothetical protein
LKKFLHNTLYQVLNQKRKLKLNSLRRLNAMILKKIDLDKSLKIKLIKRVKKQKQHHSQCLTLRVTDSLV